MGKEDEGGRGEEDGEKAYLTYSHLAAPYLPYLGFGSAQIDSGEFVAIRYGMRSWVGGVDGMDALVDSTTRQGKSHGPPVERLSLPRCYTSTSTG